MANTIFLLTHTKFFIAIKISIHLIKSIGGNLEKSVYTPRKSKIRRQYRNGMSAHRKL